MNAKPTERQLAYLSSLCTRIDGENAAESFLAIRQSAEDGDLDRKQASRLIGELKLKADSMDSPKPAPTTSSTPPGPYLLKGAPALVYKSTSGTHYLVKKLVDGQWVYQGSATRWASALTPMTLDQAAEYGRRTGVCACCGRDLTNKESIELGIGPICRGNFA